MSDWIHIPQFLSLQDADSLYAAMGSFPWEAAEAGKFAVHYGKSYSKDGKLRVEHQINPILLPLADRVAAVAHKRVNYIQCHRMSPDAIVRPHKDPAGMIVPMLTLGQARTFRVGGKMPQAYYRMRQSQRKVEAHTPAEEIVMNHGDLLIFTGGQVVHSMVAATDDMKFNPNGFDWRYSLLFRYTTDAMRQYGPGDAARKAGHDKQYREA
ncbi:MAG: hypothetical protein ACHP8B_10770 [Terriglobales bacterium]